MSRSLRLLVLFCAVSLMAPAATFAAPATPTATEGCNVTPPNGETPPGKDPDEDRWYGSGAEDASLWLRMLWVSGVYESVWSRFDGSTGHVLRFDFHRGEGSGDVTLSARHAVTGESIDDERRVLLPDDPYPVPGGFVAAVIVPQPGCWEFTATDGNDILSWTVLVSSSVDGCAVTVPNGEAPPSSPYSEEETLDWYGSGHADASLWLMMSPSQVIVPAPGFEPRDEGGYRVKTPFWRGEGSGPIELTGERLDEPSPYQPRIDADWDAYEVPGFIATGIWYPTEGCWRLTATDGNDTITWTVLVRSPFANCPVTSGTDDGGGMPHAVTNELPLTDPAAPTTVVHPTPDQFYGENGLFVLLGDPTRTVWRFPVDSEWVSDDGAITVPKWFWYRQGAAAGELSLTVKNTAQWFPTEPVIDIPQGYPASLQIASVTFPGPGCWEVTGTSGDVSITFTVRLEIVPAGAG